jgi:integrase
VNGKWKYKKAAKAAKNLTEGSFNLFWYVGNRKQYENVGPDATVAKLALVKKELELRQCILEGKAAPTVSPEPEAAPAMTITKAVDKYLAECEDRAGGDGYGLAKGTPANYARSLKWLTGYAGTLPMIAADAQFFKDFRHHLRNSRVARGTRMMSDHYAYNIMTVVNTFFLANGNESCKKVFAEMSYAEKPCVPYSDEDLTKFFDACNDRQKLLYKFFLFSGCRDAEVQHMEVKNLDFENNIVLIASNRARGFRLKGKKKAASLGRKVPIPASFMSQLKDYCRGKNLNDLLFPSFTGRPDGKLLKKAKKIGAKIGLTGLELHKFRKSFATQHHESGASIRQVQAWLGHSTLEVTLTYLGVQDAANEASQEFVNSSKLAMYA